MRYKIYEEFFEKVDKKLKGIKRKCEKYGNTFTYNIVGTEFQEKLDGKLNVERVYKFIVVEVEGTAKIDDYECVAMLENHEYGNIIHKINNDMEIPQRFKSTNNICEHCNSKRRRNTLYIIRNVKTNEFKQVGKNCLELYTEGLNAEYVTSYIDGIVELESFNGVLGNNHKEYFETNKVIDYSIEIINKIGYFNSQHGCSTKQLVAEILTSRKAIENINNHLERFDISEKFDSCDFNKKETFELRNKVIKYYLSLNNDNDFINNVQILLKDKYVELKHIGYLCYLWCGYCKYIQKEKQMTMNKEICFFGEIGKRYKEYEIDTIELSANYDSIYGNVYVYKITLKNISSVFVWKTSNQINDIENVKYITFTIKNHKEYNGIKQTEVSRCKLI